MRKVIVLSVMFSLPVLATWSEANTSGHGERQVRLRGGGHMGTAYFAAVADGAPTAIKMSQGTLHVRPGETPRYELMTGDQQIPRSGVRAAYNLAYFIKTPVAVTRHGVLLGEVDGHSAAAEEAVLMKLNLAP